MKIKIAVLMFMMSTCLCANVLPYTTSGSTYTSGVSSAFFQVYDFLGTSTVRTHFFTTPTFLDVPFEIDLTLPTSPATAIGAATVSLQPGDFTEIAPTGGLNSYGEIGLYNDYCNFFGCHYSDFHIAPHVTFYQAGVAVLTGISDGVTTTTLNYYGGTLDISSMGLDLLSGGTLRLTGYREIYTYAVIDNNGFNSYGYFGTYYDGSGTESATLRLDPVNVVTPEPGYYVALSAGFSVMLLLVRRSRTRRLTEV